MNSLIITFTRIVVWVIGRLGLGAASTWPGHIALNVNKYFIREMMENSHVKIVLIAGTNGKTTTSTLLCHVLEKQGLRVFQNVEGSNMMNGIASSIVKHANLSGKLPYDVAIFEADENIIPHIIKQVQPHAIILLNLFRDQLDRYGEVNSIASKWKKCFEHLDKKTHIIVNGDDPEIYNLGKNLTADVHYFGLPDSMLEKKEIPHDVDSIYCPDCGTKLEYSGMSYSHLGNFKCPKCDFKRENVTTFADANIEYPLKGVYNIYNTHAVALVSEKAFGISLDTFKKSLVEFKPAYGRQEELEYKGRKIFMVLSKNPTGFNQSIKVVTKTYPEKHTMMILLNDRIPDGTDVSWIWDTEFEELLPYASNIIISGDRAYDMGIRMHYALKDHSKVHNEKDNEMSFENITVFEDLSLAVEKAIELTPEGETLIILPTYSAMLDTRKILKGRSIL